MPLSVRNCFTFTLNLAFAQEIIPLEESQFDAKDEPIQELLVENYGGTLENIPTEEITFKTSADTARQLSRFPLHPTRSIIGESDYNGYQSYYRLKRVVF